MIIGYLPFLSQPPLTVLVYFHNLKIGKDKPAKAARGNLGSDHLGYVINRISRQVLEKRGRDSPGLEM